MNRTRQDVTAHDWPALAEVDAGALNETERSAYQRNRRAIDLYLSGRSINEIAKQSGVVRSHLYRLINRCLAVHDDGRLYGYRGRRVQKFKRAAGKLKRLNG